MTELTNDERMLRIVLEVHDTQHLPCPEFSPLLAFDNHCVSCGWDKSMHDAHSWLQQLLAERAELLALKADLQEVRIQRDALKKAIEDKR
jgi:hypothetical protein